MLRRWASTVLDAEHELFRDLAVGAPGGGELGDLALAGGEAAVRLARRARGAPAEGAQLAGGDAAPALGPGALQAGGGVGERGAGGGAVPERGEGLALEDAGAGGGEGGDGDLRSRDCIGGQERPKGWVAMAAGGSLVTADDALREAARSACGSASPAQ